jgi:hypothetical protein
MHPDAAYPVAWTRGLAASVTTAACVIRLCGCNVPSGGNDAGPASTVAPSRPQSEAPPPPSLSELVGQRLMVRMNGSSPSARLLARIRRGELGGIISSGRTSGRAPRSGT